MRTWANRIVFIGSLAIAWGAHAGPPTSFEARSPDGSNAIRVSGLGGDTESLTFTVSRNGRDVVSFFNYRVALADGGQLDGAAGIRGKMEDRFEGAFDLPWGKSSHVDVSGTQVITIIRDEFGNDWRIDLLAFDDAVAYRYTLGQTKSAGEFTIANESADVRFSGVPMFHYTAFSDFKSDHEGEFHRDSLPGVRGPLVDLPLIAEWPDGLALGFTEARVRDFPNLYLAPSEDLDSELFHLALSPLSGRDDACVVGTAPHPSPWRVVQLADRAGAMLESNVLLALNDPPMRKRTRDELKELSADWRTQQYGGLLSVDPKVAKDFRWAEPGKTTWHWWNGTFEHPPGRDPQMNFESHKRYIDFCAKYGIRYHAVVSDMGPWHVQSGEGFSPKPDTDILTPKPGLELERIVEYAHERGVGIRLWIHWLAIGDQLEEAFQQYEDWGISGLMIDFLNRDDQRVVQFCDEVMEAAARHELHIQFHGSYKPSGEQRTFPHLFNREAVLNLEYLKWSKRCTPPHNVEAAYVRQLAGPMDYHLGGFRSISSANFVARNENPYVLGTRCHHLAMYVVYENPMPQVCDTPEAYEGQTGFDFIVDVPVTWDETRFVAGKTGEWIVLARRKGEAWYLGGMSGWTERAVDVPLDFLPDGAFTAKLYVDGSMDQEEPNAIRVETVDVTRDTRLPVAMAAGGGFAAVVTPQ